MKSVRIRWTLAVALAIAACTTASTGGRAPVPVQASFPSTWRFRAGESAVSAKHAIVVSNDEIASRVGAEIMRQGGNAVDAAVATGFALAVTYPAAGNIGR